MEQTVRPGRRPITWFILVVNAIFPLWVLHGLDLAQQCTVECSRSSPLIPMITMWFFCDIALAVAWVAPYLRRHRTGPSPWS